jgi:hypothetical protein
MATSGTHAVQLYEEDAFLVEILARVVSEGLQRGDAVVTIATPGHRDALEQRLGREGVGLALARDTGRFLALDAAETVAALTVDGHVDAERFDAVLGAALDRAAKATRGGRVRAFGEMVSLLWSESRRDAALTLESLWEIERARRRDFSLLCAYPLAAFGAADDTPRRERKSRCRKWRPHWQPYHKSYS